MIPAAHSRMCWRGNAPGLAWTACGGTWDTGGMALGAEGGGGGGGGAAATASAAGEGAALAAAATAEENRERRTNNI